MLLRTFSYLTLALVAIVTAPHQRALAEPLSDAEFKELHAELQQSTSAPWRTIPWKIALLDARKTALAENKPIFIWAMDGHPLGCT